MKYLIPIYLILITSLDLNAQIEKKDTDTIVFETSDAIKIRASYLHPTNKTTPYPAIILIHQGGSSRKEWLDLPLINQLLENGYALLIYDIRQHGNSDKDNGSLNDLFNNPKRAPLDLQSALHYLRKDKRINPNKIGLLGASIGANLACVAASSKELNVKTSIAISAKTNAVQNLSGTKKLLSFANVFYIASKNEQKGMREFWANELFSKTKGHRRVEIAAGNKHGSYILKNNSKLQNSVLEWFKSTL